MLRLTIPVIFPAVMMLPLLRLGPGAWGDAPIAQTCGGVFRFLAWDALRLVLLLAFPVLSLGSASVVFGS